MASETCKTCAWEEATGEKVDSTRTKTSWARQIGVSEASIRRHLLHSPILQQSDAFLGENGDSIIQSVDVPDEIVTSRGMSLRDPISGSWHKVTWQPNKKALYDSLQFDDLRESLQGWEPIPTSGNRGGNPWSHGGGPAAVFNMADLQIGKANQRGGGTPETLAVVRNSVGVLLGWLGEHPEVQTVVIADNGDPIENCFNTAEQLVTNDLSVPAQIRTFRLLLLEVIKLVAPRVKRVIVLSVPSNHGAFRTGYKTPGGTVDADFGLDINEQVELACSENPYLSHVEFVRPRSLDEVAEVEVAGTKLAFAHGHRSGGVFKHGSWWGNIDHGRMAGWDADIMVFGHFHTQATYQSGDGRWVVGCASPEPGSDWFTNRTGEHSTRGLTFFTVQGGKFIDAPKVI